MDVYESGSRRLGPVRHRRRASGRGTRAGALRKAARSLLAALVAVVWVVSVGAVTAQAATVEITVSLYRVVELSCDEGAGESCGNDYYPKFKIGQEDLYDGSDDYCCAHGPDFRTNWVHKVRFDRCAGIEGIECGPVRKPASRAPRPDGGGEGTAPTGTTPAKRYGEQSRVT